jgi:hypothetical protein
MVALPYQEKPQDTRVFQMLMISSAHLCCFADLKVSFGPAGDNKESSVYIVFVL